VIRVGSAISVRQGKRPVPVIPVKMAPPASTLILLSELLILIANQNTDTIKFNLYAQILGNLGIYWGSKIAQSVKTRNYNPMVASSFPVLVLFFLGTDLKKGMS